MQNTTDISALMQNPRNIYIAIAVLTFLVAFGGGLRMPACMGVMALVAWRIVTPGSTADAPANLLARELLA